MCEIITIRDEQIITVDDSVIYVYHNHCVIAGSRNIIYLYGINNRILGNDITVKNYTQTNIYTTNPKLMVGNNTIDPQFVITEHEFLEMF